MVERLPSTSSDFGGEKLQNFANPIRYTTLCLADQAFSALAARCMCPFFQGNKQKQQKHLNKKK